jgi:hypothetical protein
MAMKLRDRIDQHLYGPPSGLERGLLYFDWAIGTVQCWTARTHLPQTTNGYRHCRRCGRPL